MRHSLDRLSIEEFCRKYPIFTTDISFRFSIIDNSDTPSIHTAPKDLDFGIGTPESYNDPEKDVNDIILARGLLETIAKGPPKAKIRIDFPALHRITVDQWNKTDSIHSYKAEEFSRRLLNVREKRKSVYELLCRYREGTNIKRTKANEISIEDLISLPKDKLGEMLENYYDELKNALPPPTRISLPHKTNRKYRTNALRSRVASLYDVDPGKEAVYKPVYGQYIDGLIQYPFFFELFAIPFKHSDKARAVFIGAVNYSISPKENGNIFEGEYSWTDEKYGYHFAEDIIKVLEEHKFNLIHAQGKLPCLVIANLVTPRRDPHGQDKSRIDTRPFTTTIIEAVSKMASGIQTYHAAGWKFLDAFKRSTIKRHDLNFGKKTKIEDLLRNFLVEQRGLPRR